MKLRHLYHILLYIKISIRSKEKVRVVPIFLGGGVSSRQESGWPSSEHRQAILLLWSPSEGHYPAA